MGFNRYKILAPMKDLPPRTVMTFRVTGNEDIDFVSTHNVLVVDYAILVRTGNGTITIDDNPSFLLNAGETDSSSDVKVERIAWTGSTAGILKVHVLDIDELKAMKLCQRCS